MRSLNKSDVRKQVIMTLKFNPLNVVHILVVWVRALLFPVPQPSAENQQGGTGCKQTKLELTTRSRVLRMTLSRPRTFLLSYFLIYF